MIILAACALLGTIYYARDRVPNLPVAAVLPLAVSHKWLDEYGRMALYFILKAMELPAGSEVVVPAFTFWVVPEIVRVAGLTPVFADIDPATFTLSPDALQRAITPRTSAVLPTHLYGLSCDMDPILAIARDANLKVIEDCAHSLGATYKGRMVGTLGDASFFSFQAFKPLNTYGGGLAWMRDAGVARRVGEFAGTVATTGQIDLQHCETRFRQRARLQGRHAARLVHFLRERVHVDNRAEGLRQTVEYYRTAK